MVYAERTARVLAALILIGLPAAALGYQFGLRPLLAPHRVVEVIAAAPEAGGFQPESIDVRAGETITLRFHAVDVTHGIAIGPGLGIDLGDIDPGHVREVTLTFPENGTYSFYCTTWCSRDHWRMRGVIAVHGGEARPPVGDPVIEALAAEGVDIDANLNHADGSHSPAHRPHVDPSAARGAALLDRLDIPADLLDADWRRSHPPTEALALLREANPAIGRAELVDAAAALWLPPTVNPAAVRRYEQNCAACHGETGAGDGFAAATTAETPSAFADPTYMFSMRADVLYAKIRRGGMGTDMPNFGTLFTPDETWALVDYLWTLALAG